MVGDTQAAIDFLRKFYGESRWVLTAVIPDGTTDTKTFGEEKIAEAFEWLQLWQGKKNLYFHVNPTRTDRTSKASKEDMYALQWLHVDIDPRAGESIEEEKARALKMLQNFPQKPTVIIDSGGGLQGFWRLKLSEELIVDGNLEKIQGLERYNLQLEKIFQADHCHNIDRIMRIPGTINLPTERKKKKGRLPTLAKLVEWNDNEFPISSFIQAVRVQDKTPGLAGGQPKVKIVSGAVLDIGVQELQDWAREHNKIISDHTCALIASGQDPINPTKYSSRSEALFKVCCDLVRADVPDEMIFAIITGNNEIAVSVRDKPNWERYANRQIERAKEDVIDPHLRHMNEKHAVISDIGGRCRVISEVYDESLERFRISKQSFEDLRNRYRHLKVVVGQTKNGVVEKPLGHFWLDHPQRRQYEKIIFAPGKDVSEAYNLWQGFAVEPTPGSGHESFLQHTKENLCSGNDQYYEYLINWLARLVQHPDKTGQVAIVLKGERGTGKSFWAKTIGRLFGRHFMQVSDSKHLVGSFNAHLRDTVLLFGDEAFFAGDRKHESVLKTLVTEEILVVEGKGIDAEAAPNYVHLILASNEEWVIPAGLDERRFFALEISPNGKGKFEYFQAIQSELTGGGYASLLHFLLTRDISKFEVRDYPKTEALQQQKILSMSAEMQWLYNKLQHGYILKHDSEWKSVIVKEHLYEDYIVEMQEQSKQYRQGRTGFFNFLSSVMPEGFPVSRQQQMLVKVRNDNGHLVEIRKRVYVVEFPALDVLRAHWDNKMGGPFHWQPVAATQGELEPEDRVEF